MYFWDKKGMQDTIIYYGAMDNPKHASCSTPFPAWVAKDFVDLQALLPTTKQAT